MSPLQLDRSRVPAPGALKPFRFPEVQHEKLSNGLPVYFSRTDGLEVATFSLLLAGGAIREEPARAGLATLTGALLESGTARLGPAELSERLESLGVRLQVGTSWEVAHVDFTALTSRVEDAAELAAELVRSPAFPAEEVDRLKNQMLASILQRRAEPRGFASELASRFIFSEESPYSRPLGGYRESVGRLGPGDVREYHDTFYSPVGAGLVVAGRMDLGEVLEVAERCFGGWRGPALPALDPPVTPRVDGMQVIIVERPGAVQSEIRIGHVGVARNTPDFFAINVMNTILGGAFSSRLNLNLREKHGFTYGVRSGFAMRRRPGPFIVSTAVQTEVTGAAVREILAELGRMREDSVEAGELEDARQYVAGTFPLPLQTTDGVAARLSELFVYDLPDSYLDDFSERTLAVGPDEVLRVARSHLRPDQLTILVLGDPTLVRPQLDELGIGAVETISQEAIP